MRKITYILFSVIVLATVIYTAYTYVFYNNVYSVKNNAVVNIGDKAPEISMKNLNDSVISLSSLKGKLVLIDFWASWCGPCRMENPSVVAAYKKYKNEKFKKINTKGFVIFSVSLDKNKTAWANAVTKDSLSWPYHVSDLKYWNNEAAKLYGVYVIPYNFLIDKDGIVIAKNLRGANLEIKLEELKNK